jgi:LacI family transcriptional regulator
MPSRPPRVAVMLDIEVAFQRHTDAFAGVVRYAQELEWEVIMDEYAGDTLPARRTDAIPYDGVIARATRKLYERARHLGVPVVNLWNNSPVCDHLPGVFPDYVKSGSLRAEHLLSRGLIRFAALTSRTRGQDIELKSFCDTISEAGYTCITATSPLTATKPLSNWRRTEKVVAKWMEEFQTPIGVYVGSDVLGRIVAQMCRSHGFRVPEDVAIVAGWNEQTFCEQPAPSLTSIDLDVERIGHEAARLLHSLMDGDAPPAKHILLPPRGLVVRESTDFVAVEDEQVAEAIRFIAANSHRRIGPKEVARAVGANTRTLQLRFGKYLNRPIATEIRRQRIERAKRELTQSKRRLSDIARDVGFGQAMRMYEVFRRELGVTPSEYRQQRQVQERL